MRIAMVFKQTIAVVTSLSLMVPPGLAQSIVADAGVNAPQVLNTANGLPMVMITAPNAAGVSHNTYTSFNVPSAGAILNNVNANMGPTQQAGLVQGNSKLLNGTASLIINEVTANNPSALNGYLEVAGARADVVVANPYGVTCNGCGFINTDRATLTTGVPVFSGDSLRGLSVEGGAIAIGTTGADARGVGTFDLIAQRISFAGAVHGERVRVLAGRNDVIYATGAVTAKSPSGAVPELAIDSTVVGGMYANAITIHSTQQGAGVRAPATMSASAGNMQITAEGKLIIGRAATTGQATVAARDIEVEKQINAQQGISATAVNSLTAQADALIVSQAALSLGAGQDMAFGAGTAIGGIQAVTLTSGKNTDFGAKSIVVSDAGLNISAGGNLSFGAEAALQAVQSLGLKSIGDTSFGQGAKVNARSGLDVAAAGHLAFGADSALQAEQAMILKAGASLTMAERVTAVSQDRLDLTSGGNLAFGSAGVLQAKQTIALASGGALSLGNGAAAVSLSNLDLTSAGNLTLGQDSILRAGQAASIRAGAALAMGDRATALAQGKLDVTSVGNLVLGAASALQAVQAVALKSGDALTMGDGANVLSQSRLDLASGGNLALGVASTLQAGQAIAIVSGAAVTFGDRAAALAQDKLDLTSAANLALGTASTLQGLNTVTIKSGADVLIGANAKIQSEAALDLASGGALTAGAAAVLQGAKGVVIKAGTDFAIGADAKVLSGSTLNLAATGKLSTGAASLVQAATDVVIQSGSDAVFGGGAKVLSDTTLQLTAGGKLSAGIASAFQGLKGASLKSGLDFFIDRDARILSEATLNLNVGGNLDLGQNSALRALQALAVLATGNANFGTGFMVSSGSTLTLDSARMLTFGAGGVAQAAQSVGLKSGQGMSLGSETKLLSLTNLSLTSGADLSLGSASVVQAAQGIALEAATNIAAGTTTKFFSQAALSLTAQGNLALGPDNLLQAAQDIALKSGGELSLGDRTTILSLAKLGLVAGGDLKLGTASGLQSDLALTMQSAANASIGQATKLISKAQLSLNAAQAVTFGSAAAMQGDLGVALQSGGDMTLAETATLLSKANLGLISGGNLALGASSFLQANGALKLDSSGNLTFGAQVKALSLSSLDLIAKGNLAVGSASTLQAATAMNISAGADMSFADSAVLLSQTQLKLALAGGLSMGKAATLQAVQAIDLQAVANADFGDDAKLVTQSALTVAAGGGLSLGKKAVLQAAQAVQLQSGTDLSLGANATILSEDRLTLTAGRGLSLGVDTILQAAKAASLQSGADFLSGANAKLLSSASLGLTAGGNLTLGQANALQAMQAVNLQSGAAMSLGAKTTVLSQAAIGLNATGALALGSESAIQGTGAVTLTSANDLTMGEAAKVLSQSNLTLTATGDLALGKASTLKGALATKLQAGKKLTLQEQALLVSNDSISVKAASLDTGKQAMVLAGEQNANGTRAAADLTFDITNAANLVQTRLMASQNIRFDAASITVDANPLLPASAFVALGSITAKATDIGLGQAKISSENNLLITASKTLDIAKNADLFSRAGVTISADHSRILGGSLLSGGDISISGRQIDMAAGAVLQSAKAISLSSTGASLLGVITAERFSISAAGDVSLAGNIYGQNAVTLDAAALTASGNIRSMADIAINAAGISQSGILQAKGLINLNASKDDIALSGTLVAGKFTLTAGRNIDSSALILDNRALAFANGASDIPAAQSFIARAVRFTNKAGGTVQLASPSEFALSGDFVNAGDVAIRNDLTVAATGSVSNSGKLTASGQLTLTSAQVSNQSGAKIEGSQLGISAPILVNTGQMNAGNSATLQASSQFINTGTVASANALGLTTADLVNSGTLSADQGVMSVNATSFGNASGTLKSGTGIAIATATWLLFGGATPNGGTILSDGHIQIQGLNGAAVPGVTIENSAQFVAGGDVSIHAASLSNAGVFASARGNMVLRVPGSFNNTGLMYSGGSITLGVRDTVLNSANTMMAAKNLTICGYDLAACLANPSNSRAEALRNINGGRIETLGGDLTLSANTISNERDVVFVAGVPQTTVSDKLWTGVGGCHTWIGCGYWWSEYVQNTTVTTTDSITINGSASQFISASRIDVFANDFSNSYAVVSARGALSVNASSAANIGAIAYQTVDWRQDRYHEGSNNGGIVYSHHKEVTGTSVTQTLLGSAPAIIEAGGIISGTISGSLDNVAANKAALSVAAGSNPALPSSAAGASSPSLSGLNLAQPSSLAAASVLEPISVSLPNGQSISATSIALADFANDQLFKINLADGPVAAIETAAGQISALDTPSTSALAINSLSAGSQLLTRFTKQVDLLNPASGTTNATLAPVKISKDQQFQISTNSQASYLIETRHSFINQAAFESSDYFLASLNFAPEITQRRLGDAMVETMAVRNQLLQLTGGTILQNGLSERQQMQMLYQNGIDAAKSLNLRPGVALDPTQIAALTGSMIWLEEQVVGGTSVLVPRLYLASSAGRATDGGGAIIRAGQIALNVGNVTNSGSISATDGLTLLASGNISNNFGSMTTGGDLSLFADNGTFLNLSGQISGRNVTIGAADIRIETAATETDWLYGSAVTANRTASIAAAEALTINGLAGIDLIGASLTGGTALQLASLGDISVTSLKLQESFALQTGNSAFERESTRFLASNLSVGSGDLTISGNNITLRGADLAASGTISLISTGQLQLLADVQTDYNFSFSRSNGFLRSSVNRSESFDATSIGTALNGGAIAIRALGDIEMQAAELSAQSGQIGVTSTSGNIALLAAVDIHARYDHSSSSFLGGLFSSSSTTERLNTTIAANDLAAKTDVAVRAGNDLALVGGNILAGGDVSLAAGNTLTLAGAVGTNYTATLSNNNSGFFIVDKTDVALTQSADFTKITAGGKVSVTGAEMVANLDPYSAAFGLNAKSQIGIDGPESDQRLAASREAPGSSAGGAGGAGDPAYDFAASRVNIGLPTALDDGGYAYLDDLKASGQLTVQEMALVQHEFSDQQVQLGTLGQLLLQYVTAGMTSGLTGAQAAMAQAAISGGVQGAVSGNFDLGKILQDVAFAGVSGAATAGFDLNDTLKLGNESLLGMVDGKLSFASIANSLGDSVITAGLTTAVYGGTFGDNFQRSFTNSVVMTGLADVQKAIGDFAKVNGIAEGSTQHVILHTLAGCFGAAAAGGDCAAGAAAGMAQSIYAGTLDGTVLSDAAQQRNAQLLGGIAAAFATGGESAATMLASNIALSGMANNRQLHREEAEWIRNNAGDLARELGVSVETAQAMLTGELLRRVSDDFSSIAPDQRVANFVNANAPLGRVVDGQNLFAELARGSKEYRNSAINISNLRDYAALYQSFTPKVMGLQDNRTEEYFGQNVDWLYYLAAKDGIGRLPDWQGATADFSTLAVEFNRALGTAGINDAGAYELWSTISGATAITTSAGGSREIMFERMAQFSDEELGALVLGRGEMVMNLVEAFTGSQATKFAMKQALAEVGKKYRLTQTEISINAAGAGRYVPNQPLDASGNPILRTNDRGGVLVQPNGSVTCGQHACGMVLNTQGRPVAVDDIIRTHGPDFTGGSSQTQLQRALRDNGIGSTAFSGRSVSDLGRYTSDGRPAIATVQTGPDTYHAVVVDGVTTRGGQPVVAIRDPAGGINGGVYYETVSSFEARFTGHAIRMDNQ